MSSYICLFLVCSQGSWRSKNRADQDEKEQKEQEKEGGTNSSDEGQNRGRLGDMRDVGKNDG